MLVERMPIKNLCIIRLNTGDDVLLSINEAIKKLEIKNAIIIAGTGSTVNHHFHVIASANVPPGNLYTKEDKPSDVVNINGFIINGRPHVHITHTDKEIGYGGHLEEGVKVCTFISITMVEIDFDLDGWDGMGRIEDLRKK
jgi:predicted DNA-binding protein with PD1-like motif